MAGKRTSTFSLVVLLLILLLSIGSTLLAEAFPFREFEVGDPVPEVTLQGVTEPQALSFSSLKGKPFVAVFWGADLPEKAEHSAEVLAGIETLADFLAQRQVQLVSVNVQDDEGPIISRVVQQSGSSINVYRDQDRAVYADLGLFVMPTVLVVDRAGIVAAGMGYSRDLVDRLKGSIEIMLGEKTPAQVEAELRPEMVEASPADKDSLRHYEFGVVMLKRGQLAAALREFGRAVEIDPAMADAHLQLGWLYLDQDRLSEAEKAIAAALHLEPDSIPGRVCRAELKRKKGQSAEVVRDMQAILAKDPQQFRAFYTLGRAHEDQQQPREAAAAYKEAYRLILLDSTGDQIP